MLYDVYYYIETVFSTKKGALGLIADNLLLELSCISLGNIGGIHDDEGKLATKRREYLSHKEVDTRRNTVQGSILSGDTDGACADIAPKGNEVCPFGQHGDDHRAGPHPQFEDPTTGRGTRHGLLYQQLGFGSRNEDLIVDEKRPGIKFLLSEDIGNGFSLCRGFSMPLPSR